MKNKTRPRTKVIINVTIIVLMIGVIVLGIYNAKKNDTFLDASLTGCISIMVAIGVSYFFVQQQNDVRKQKDIIMQLMTTIQTIVTDKCAYCMDSSTKMESLTMRNRDLGNRLRILDSCKDEFNISDDVDFMMEKYTEYVDFISDHITDTEYLSSSSNALRRPLDLISERIVGTMLKLYH